MKSRSTATFNLKAEWRDARLTWKDLEDDVALNLPSKEQNDILWFPKILIANSEKSIGVPND